uniref:Phosphodiesterase 1A n=1 Tax=Pundamilia nyererei TaxID=303518 RepID=A0A3B4G183_9CICH
MLCLRSALKLFWFKFVSGVCILGPIPLRTQPSSNINKAVLEQMDRGMVDLQELRRHLELAAAMLDAVYTDETRRLLDTEDELSDLQAESVPSEVRDWLACTFSRKMGVAKRRPEEKPRFRSIVHAVQAGIFVERMYRRTSNMAGLTYPPTALTALKEVDQWSFDVFAFHEATGEHALKFLVYDLLTLHPTNSSQLVSVRIHFCVITEAL